MKLKDGDVVIELATRIETQVIWREVKQRGGHFLNSGFDVWADALLDLAGLDNLQKVSSEKKKKKKEERKKRKKN